MNKFLEEREAKLVEAEEAHEVASLVGFVGLRLVENGTKVAEKRREAVVEICIASVDFYIFYLPPFFGCL